MYNNAKTDQISIHASIDSTGYPSSCIINFADNTCYWVSQLAEEIMTPSIGIFTRTPNSLINELKTWVGSEVLMPNPTAAPSILELVGAFIASCVHTGNPQEFRIPQFLWDFILRKEITYESLKEIDSSIEEREDKEEFLQTMINQSTYLRNGFYEVIPEDITLKMNSHILQILAVGNNELTVKAIAAITKGSRKKIFIEALKEFNQEELRKCLAFITGSHRIPLTTNFTIRADPYYESEDVDDEKRKLPVAHTCSKSIDICDFKNPKILADKLRVAIEVMLITDSESSFSPENIV